MNTPFTRTFHQTIVASFILFGCTTLSVLAQTSPSVQPPVTPAKPATAPVQTPAKPAVTKQNSNAPVRIAPAQQPMNGQVGNNPLDTNQSVPTRINPNTQASTSQPINGQVGNNPLNYNESIPTSQAQNTQTSESDTVPAGVGYNNKGGIVNSNALQSDAHQLVHYHYHYNSAGQPIGNAPAGYAPATYVNPDNLDQSARSNNNSSGHENSEYNYSLKNDEGGMYQYQTNNWNPNSRVGPGGNGGGTGVNATWNPYLNNGAGMLTYGGAGGVEGFND